MSDASDTFRLGLDAADRPEPSYPGDGIGDGQPDEPVLVEVTAFARDLVPGDLVTELDTPEGPWYGVLTVEGDRVVVDAGEDGGCLPVDLPFRGTDRCLVRREPVVDLASETAAVAIDPGSVTVAPSLRYGFRQTSPTRWETGERAVVQVVQAIAARTGAEFHPTPARYYADQVAGWSADRALSIDHGQGWALSIDDTAAFIAFAAGVDA